MQIRGQGVLWRTAAPAPVRAGQAGLAPSRVSFRNPLSSTTPPCLREAAPSTLEGILTS